MSNNMKSALCYFPYIGGFWGLYILFTEKTDKTARFNAIQGLCLIIALDLIVWLLMAFLYAIPFIGRIVAVLCLLLEGFLFYKTYKGEEVILPLIGPFAKDHA